MGLLGAFIVMRSRVYLGYMYWTIRACVKMVDWGEKCGCKGIRTCLSCENGCDVSQSTVTSKSPHVSFYYIRFIFFQLRLVTFVGIVQIFVFILFFSTAIANEGAVVPHQSEFCMST